MSLVGVARGDGPAVTRFDAVDGSEEYRAGDEAEQFVRGHVLPYPWPDRYAGSYPRHGLIVMSHSLSLYRVTAGKR